MTHGDSWANVSVVYAVATYALLGLVMAAWLSRSWGWLSAFRRVDAWISKQRGGGILLIVFIAFLAFLPAHALTLRAGDDHAAHHELLIDHWRFFGPQADDVLRGDNPYANVSHGDNHGLLRLWPSVVAVALGGYVGSVVVWTAFCFLVPLATRWSATRAGIERRGANYAALLVLVTPAALEMNAIMAQEDGLVAVAVLVPLALLLGGRPGWSAVAAGVLAHVKFPTLFFTAPAFALLVARVRSEGTNLAAAFVDSVRYGLAAVAAFMPLFTLGAALYGAPYVRSILGVADPLHAPHQFALQSFTLADLVRDVPSARPFLIATSALVLVVLLAFFYLRARRFDPVGGGLLLLIGFFLTGYYLKEHYLSWAMPLVILWALRARQPARVLAPATASVFLHAWAVSAGGLIAEQPTRSLAAAAQTVLLLGIAAQLLREMGSRPPTPGERHAPVGAGLI